jgi:16S rRNA (cytosine967-C5)-methyltransferase
MKLYKNLVNAVALILQDIFTKNRYADKAIEQAFRQNPQWGSRDRRFIAEGVYDIVRHFRLYSELAESPGNFWFITAVWLVIKNGEVPDWQEFRHVNPAHILSRKAYLEQSPPVYESYPDWLWELGLQELGEPAWAGEARAMNVQAPVFLRANSLKTSREALAEQLKKERIETSEVNGVTDALKLSRRDNVFQTRLFREGFFEVQDAGSQLISEFLDPKPGEFVVDACAGAGGKSLHLAALMKNKGKIISLDVEAWKLEELKKRARRAGVFNVEARPILPGETISQLKDKADRLLLDVPCSGLGVLKRNPDTKWKLSSDAMEGIRATQQEILSAYSSMLKTGGHLVYSTCSILPSENRQQVDTFLERHASFGLVRERTLLPSEGFDGFYMALLKKTA